MSTCVMRFVQHFVRLVALCFGDCFGAQARPQCYLYCHLFLFSCLSAYTQEYGVSFPVTGKVGINKERHAFYEVIADLYGPDALPQWNFGKILICRDGEVKGMFPPQMSPLDAEVVTAITRELESKTKRIEIA